MLLLRVPSSSSPAKGLYDPKAFITHAASLDQGCPHCPRFPTAASRRSLGRVSVPVWPIILSDRLRIEGLVGRYPTNYLIRRGPIPGRIFSPPLRKAYPVLPAVSRSYPGPQGRFPRVTHPSATHRPKASASDLHVLGAPPAFVLSQDQTLSLISDHHGSRKAPIRNPKGSPMNTKDAPDDHPPRHPRPQPSRPRPPTRGRRPHIPPKTLPKKALHHQPCQTAQSHPDPDDHRAAKRPPTRSQQTRPTHNAENTSQQTTAAAQLPTTLRGRVLEHHHNPSTRKCDRTATDTPTDDDGFSPARAAGAMVRPLQEWRPGDRLKAIEFATLDPGGPVQRRPPPRTDRTTCRPGAETPATPCPVRGACLVRVISNPLPPASPARSEHWHRSDRGTRAEPACPGWCCSGWKRASSRRTMALSAH